MHYRPSAPSQERRNNELDKDFQGEIFWIDLDLPFQYVIQINLGLLVDVQVNKIGNPCPPCICQIRKVLVR